MTRQNSPPQRRNCRGVYTDPEKLLDALCEHFSRRKRHPMADIITIIFLAAFFFTLGYYIGRGR